MRHYVGLDVSMKETFICVVDEEKTIVYQGKTETEPQAIAECLKKIQVPIEKVGIESGCLTFWLTKELKNLSVPAICVDARKMSIFLSGVVNKTDKNDARGIAEAMRCDAYHEIVPKSERAIEIQAFMNCRRLLVDQKTQTANVIRGTLKAYGIRLGSASEGTFIQKVQEKIVSLPFHAKQGLEALLRVFLKLCEEIDELTKRVEKLARENKVTKRLMTIPGIGPITALQYVVEIDDPTRFRNSRAVGAYLGMTPRQYSSGETKRQGPISKCGSSEMRTLLVEGAMVLLTRSKAWSKLKAWGMKIQRKHGLRKASMAVGRKLAIIMHKMWLQETVFIYGEDKQKTANGKKALAKN